MTADGTTANSVLYRVESRCRACGTGDLRDVLEYGASPIADGLLEANELGRPEPRAPLSLALCPECSLLQIRETVDPHVLFSPRYPYFSSTSASWLTHCRDNALELIDSLTLGPESSVVEIASNDGYMLRNFKDAGIPVLGIDPAGPPADAATRAGIPTRREFFDEDLAADLARQGQLGDLVLANNVLAHVPDLRGFVRGLSRILKPAGTLVIEVPYARDLIEACEFDTVYHQHLCYFALAPLVRLMAAQEFQIHDVRRLSTHGGSLRCYIGKNRKPSAAVARMLEEERASDPLDADRCRDFARQAVELAGGLKRLLQDLHREGKRVAAYGAAAKATTLLHLCGIDVSILDYVVDSNPYKHGKYLPGARLEIRDPTILASDRPDYLLLLAWNLRDEILPQQRPYLEAGGQIIVPLPRLEIIPASP
jgi:SAM-dependent methyltransferase